MKATTHCRRPRRDGHGTPKLSKLGVSTRTEAVALALQHHLVS
jgi:hypothetical protein